MHRKHRKTAAPGPVPAHPVKLVPRHRVGESEAAKAERLRVAGLLGVAAKDMPRDYVDRMLADIEGEMDGLGSQLDAYERHGRGTLLVALTARLGSAEQTIADEDYVSLEFPCPPYYDPDWYLATDGFDRNEEWHRQMRAWWAEVEARIMRQPIPWPGRDLGLVFWKRHDDDPAAWLSLTAEITSGQCEGMSKIWLLRGDGAPERLASRDPNWVPVPVEEPSLADELLDSSPLDPQASARYARQPCGLGKRQDLQGCIADARAIDWVVVRIENTYIGRSTNYYAVVAPPRPLKGKKQRDEELAELLDEWWEEAVWPYTGDGGPDTDQALYTAEIEWAPPWTGLGYADTKEWA